MRDDLIEPDEKLFRAVKPNPQFWENAENRPTSALFKDSKGVSIDRDAKRDLESITAFFTKRMDDLRGICKIFASFCFEQKLRPLPKLDPDQPENIYHGEIHGKEKIQLTGGEARTLSKHAEFIPIPPKNSPPTSQE